MKRFQKIIAVLCLVLGLGCFATAVFMMGTTKAYATSYGATRNAPNASDTKTGPSTGGFDLSFDGDTGTLSSTVRILLVLTVISLAPAILVMLTSFTRIVIVLHFIRMALGTQTSPPNQVMIGLALFLTLFIMWPTANSIYNNAIVPLDAGKITQEKAYNKIKEPIREFMYGQTQEKDLNLFCDIAGIKYKDYDDVPCMF